MGGIRRLKDAVCSSLRSSVVLFDIARVVEELLFNSLDAGARKVCVYVGIGTCYVRVEDDGSGITRDGLVLLGDRHATSKVNVLNNDEVPMKCFGFRGESLASISDASLLEIITKVQGSPNGFRKVMKGSQCMFIGISDDRQAVGTTVVVRDLFYNQPVRRKQMQSSVKKTVHSIKKCILRIALVHCAVSFEVVDIESEEELLCTHASVSPLPIITNCFGVDICRSLHELNFSDCELKVSGYVARSEVMPSSTKAFQFIYINSRLICKCPIHKLLNKLFDEFKCSQKSKSNVGFPATKIRSQAPLVYLLNIHCPYSWYDLMLEPSKASVEFKNWALVLNFIEKAINNFWSEHESHDNYHDVELDVSKGDLLWNGNDNDALADNETQDLNVKWGHAVSRTVNNDKSQHEYDSCDIPDISSGNLHVVGDSLIPESIDRKSLDIAKVLQQVDKKFIPVVSGSTLIMIDQHAADERIRVEELRQKVHSGEMRTISYLDVERELVLPGIGYQMLQNYSEKIKSWGWICNIFSEKSEAFTRNLNILHKQKSEIKLIAVPCILGVTLSDADLLEFLQQLVDTDGSATMPPAVIRILNSKACRGAIMFGDRLLLSECSLIVEELRHTSLWFQCAHGRPTAVPLVNLKALRKLNKEDTRPWHGLRKHPPSLNRALLRLEAASS